MIRRFPIAAATLALSLTASASMAAEGNQLSQDDEQLKSALAGAPRDSHATGCLGHAHV